MNSLSGKKSSIILKMMLTLRFFNWQPEHYMKNDWKLYYKWDLLEAWCLQQNSEQRYDLDVRFRRKDDREEENYKRSKNLSDGTFPNSVDNALRCARNTQVKTSIPHRILRFRKTFCLLQTLQSINLDSRIYLISLTEYWHPTLSQQDASLLKTQLVFFCRRMIHL